MWTLFRAWWSLRRVTACSRRQAGSLASNSLGLGWGLPGLASGGGRGLYTAQPSTRKVVHEPSRGASRGASLSASTAESAASPPLAERRHRSAARVVWIERVVWRPGLPTVKSGGSGRDRCRSAHITPATNALPSLQLDPCSQAHSKACNTCSIPQRLLN